MQRLKPLLVTLTATLLATAAAAQEPPVYDRIDLTASAEREVGNDLLIAVVYAEFEDNDQANAANAVNESIRWATDRARRVDGVEIQTMQYTTRPVYSPNSRRISGWIARQSLRLESGDAEALSELLGDLQSRVAIQSIGYGLSKAARDAAENELIAEALAQFARRAELVASELGRDGYRIVHLNVGLPDGFFPRNDMRVLGVAESAQAAAPQIEAGQQTVRVTVNGTIELDGYR